MVEFKHLTAFSPETDAAGEAFSERAVLDNASITPAIEDMLGTGPAIKILLESGPAFSDLIGAGLAIKDMLMPMPTVNDLIGPMPTVNDLIGPMPTISDLIGPMPTVNDLIGPMPTVNDLIGPMPTISDLIGPMPTISDLIGPMPTISDLIGPSISDLNKAIPLSSRVGRILVSPHYPSPEVEEGVRSEYEVPAVRERRSLEWGLSRLDPDLLNLLQGARAALNTVNPDRPRHVIVSLRELVTHVLHLLAPDVSIQNWNSDPDCYHNGRPTRRTRLLYINRNINSGPLSKSFGAHVTWALTLMDELNAGSHVISSRLTEQELQALVVETESLLYSIIGIFFLSQARTTPPM